MHGQDRLGRTHLFLLLSALAVAALLTLPVSAHAYDDVYVPTQYWPVVGATNYSPLTVPEGVALDASNNVYVADTQNARVQVYDDHGNYLRTIGELDDGGKLLWLGPPYNVGPKSVAVDSSYNVYVSDTANHRVVMYDSAGHFVRAYGVYSAGWTGPGTLDHPRAIAIDSHMRVWVTDLYNNVVQVFDPAANPILNPNYCVGVVGYGELPGPSGICFDPTGNLWVSDILSHELRYYDVDDSVSTSVTASFQKSYLTTDINPTFLSPHTVVMSPAGYLFVTDFDLNRVVKVDPNTGLQVGTSLQGAGEWILQRPESVAVNASDTVFVMDTQNERVVKFVNVLMSDSDPPISHSDIPETWVQGPVDVSLESTDTQSHVAYILYGIGVASPSETYTAPFRIYDEGTTTVVYKAVDYASNVEDPKRESLRIDDTPPVTHSTVPTGWTTLPVEVRFDATDAFSGVQATLFSLNEGELFQYDPYSDPLVVSDEGTTTLSYFSVDYSVGDSSEFGFNAEEPRTDLIRIDTQAPWTTSDVIPDHTYGGSAVIHLTGDDLTSGVATTYYSIDGSFPTIPYAGSITITGEGTALLRYYSVDQAGNVEGTVNADAVSVDGVPPTTTSNIDALWHSGTFMVSLSATDTFAVRDTFYRLDSGAVTTYTGTPFPVSGEGEHFVSYWSDDYQSNVETTRTGTVRIDNTPPTSHDNVDSEWRMSAFAVYLSSEDTRSGMSYVLYRVNGSAIATYGGSSFDVGANGYNTVEYLGVDNAGNRETTRTAIVKVDHIPPVTSCDATLTSQVAQLVATDTLSGVTHSYYSTDGSFPTNEYNPALGIPIPNAPYVPVKWYSVDVVGNAETVQLIELFYDAIPPVTTSNIAGGWKAAPFRVQLSATDDKAGVANTFYRVNGGVTTTYTAPGFDIGTEGATAVSYWSVDAVGNIEASKTETAWVDATLPTSSSNFDGVSAWVSTNQTVTITASDTPSGLGAIWYRVNGGALATTTASVGVSTNGTNTVEYFARDAAGNRDTTHTAVVRLDKADPVTNTNIDGVKRRGNFTVTLMPSDGESGVRYTYYKVNGGFTQSYYGPFVVYSDGTTVITFWSVDWVGNREDNNTATVMLDNIPPSTTLTGADSAWHSTPQTMTMSAVDTLSPPAVAYYRVDGVGLNTYVTPFAISTDGAHLLEYWSMDNIGNLEATKTATVKIDMSAPVTTSNADAAWHDGAWRMSLTATDPLSGLAYTYYRVNGGATTTYTASFAFSNSGANTVEYWSKDVLGNREATKTATVYVDLTPPSSSSTADSSWHRSPVSLSLMSTDTLSGVSVIKYRIGAGAVTTYAGPIDISAQGANVVSYWGTDNVGNVETTKTATVNIDDTEPVTTSSIDTLWHSANVTVTLSPTDPYSGVKSTYYKINNGGWLTYSSPFQVTAEGATTVSWYSVDWVNNAETAKNATVKIERVAPVTTDNAPPDWVHGPATVNLAATDGTSGVLATRYRLNGSAATTGTVVSVSAEGTNTILYWSLDNAGNVETTKTAYVPIDNSAPITGSTIDGSWHSHDVTVTLTPADTYSGPSATSYKVGDAGTWLPYAGPFSVSAEGLTNVYWYSTDRVGNLETTKSATVKIDRGAPVTTDDAAGDWVKGPITVHLSPTDGTSGVSTTNYKLNGGGTLSGTSVAVSAEGTNTILYWSTDAADNVEATKTAYVRIDNTVPLTTSTIDSAWRSGDVTVTLVPSDGVSGVATTWYKVDTGDWQSYLSPFAVTAEGQTDVFWYSVDQLGNTEATKTGTVKIDRTAPITSSNATSTYLNNSGQTISLTTNGDAAASGVLGTRWRMDGSAWTTGTSASVPTALGTHMLEFYSIDNVGNAETTRSATFTIVRRIDHTDSLIYPHGAWSTATNAAHFGGSIRQASATTTAMFAFRGTEAHLLAAKRPDGGIARITLDGTQTSTVSFFNPSTWLFQQRVWSVASLIDTTHTVVIEWQNQKDGGSTGYSIDMDAVDVAGSLVAYPDVTPPVTATNVQAFYRDTATVSFTAADSETLVTATRYRLDGGAWSTGSSVTTTVVGHHVLDFYSTDTAGNAETVQTASFDLVKRLDNLSSQVVTSGPWVARTHPGDFSGSSVYAVTNAYTYVLFSGTRFTWIAGRSPQCGIAEVSLDGADPVLVDLYDPAYLFQQSVWTTGGLSQGQHVVRIRATGSKNTSATEARVYVDGFDVAGQLVEDVVAPHTEIAGASAWMIPPYSLQLSAIDTGIGLSSTKYRLDGSAITTYSAPVNISAPGVHTIEYWSTDIAGNTEASHVMTLGVDGLPPVTTDDAPLGWSNAPVSVALTATDTLSGVSATSYRIDSGSVATYSAPVAVSTPGTHALDYWSTDTAGNREETRTATVRIDMAAPVTSGEDDGTWHRGTPALTLVATDALSGVERTTYSLNGGTDTLYAEPILIQADGVNTVVYRSLDIAGNLEDTRTTIVRVDNADPTTTDDAPLGWSRVPVSVALHPDDGLSGVGVTWYSLDHAAEQTYTGPIAVAEPGVHTIDYYSTDLAGNTEDVCSATVMIDGTAPVTTDDAPSSWTTPGVRVSLTASDTLSGVSATHYVLDGGDAQTYAGPIALNEQGVHEIDYWSSDVAGNAEERRTVSVLVDDAAPVTTNDALSAYVGTATVTLEATDAVSGVRATYCRLDDGIWFERSSETTTKPGSHVLQYYSLDQAGNVEATRSVAFDVFATVDDTDERIVFGGAYSTHLNTAYVGDSARQISATGTAYLNFTGTAVRIIAAKRPDGGIMRVTLDSTTTPASVDLFNPSVWSFQQRVFSVTGLTNGTHTLKLEWTGLKNPASSSTVVNVDAVEVAGTLCDDVQPPATLLAAQQNWSNRPVTFILSATDVGGGVKATYYTVDGGMTALYGLPVTLSAPGVHTIEYWSVDLSENIEEHHFGTISIDTAAPTTLTDLQSGYDDTATVTLSPSDPDSGPAWTRWRADGGAWTTGTVATIPGRGVHSLDYYSVDNAGNAESTRTCSVNVFGRFDHTDARFVYEGAWATHVNGAHFGGTARQITATSTAFISFTGSGVKIIAAKRPDGGIARVTLDGTAPVDVDLYNASTWLFQQRIYSVTGLANTSHTLKVEWTGSKNASATASTVNIDAFDVAGGVSQYYLPADQSDSRIRYEGVWSLHSNASHYCGTTNQITSAGTAYVNFTGSAIRLLAAKRPDGGIARVTLDNAAPVTIDLYNPSSWLFQQRVYSASGLSTGTHTLKFEWTGSKNASATATTVNLDAIEVAGDHPDAIAPVTTSNAQTTYATNATITLSPTDASGIAYTKWRLDSGAWTTGTVVATSTIGAHSLDFYSVDAAGNFETQKNTSFNVSTRIDETDPRIVFDGSWGTHNHVAYFGGVVRQINATGTAYVGFTGTGITLVATKRPDGGKARVTLDSTTPVNVDLYNPSVWVFQQKVYTITGLANTAHVLKFEWTGSKNTSATGSTINLDAADVSGAATQYYLTADHTDSRIRFDGAAWANHVNGAYFGGTAKQITAAGAAYVNFTGTGARLVAAKRPDGGLARVTVDGGTPTMVDLYNPSVWTFQQRVFSVSSLENTSHTIKVEWTGSKNASSTGTNVNLDAVDVAGSHPDAIAPVTTTNAQPTYATNATITLSPTDASGIAYTMWRLNGGPWQTGSVVATSAIGSHVLDYFAVDRAGNFEQQKTLSFDVFRRIDDVDTRVVFDGAWITHVNGGYNAGTARQITATGTAYVNFTGTGVKLVSAKRPDGGVMRVTLDSTAPVNVDLYNASTWLFQQRVYSVTGLTNTTHTLKVEWTGTKNAAATTSTVNLDAIEVAGDANQYYLRVDQTDQRILFDGAWQNHLNGGYYLGAAKQITATGTVYVNFNGTGAKLIASKRPDGGIARVTLDGTTVSNVDLYNASTWLFQQPVWTVTGLSNTSHTLKVEWTGTKNGAASATTVNFDAIDVAGTVSAAPDLVPPSTTSNAVDTYADTATITLSPTDSLSGVNATYWRLDEGGWTTGTVVASSAIGPHTLDFYSVDKQNNREATNTVAFHILRRVDESDSGVAFDAAWDEATHYGYYCGTSRTLNATGSVEVTFTGTAINLLATKRPDAGVMKVSVDGGPSVDVDLYNPSIWVFQRRVWSLSGLSNTTHTLTASWSGTKNASATGTGVNLDAIEVEGTVP